MIEFYDLEFERVEDFLRDIGAEKVAIQLPEGLRPLASDIAEGIRGMNLEILFMGGSCYGACDIADESAGSLGCDGLIQYGHSEMDFSTSIPTLFVEARSRCDLLGSVENLLDRLKGSAWGLVATVQHVDNLDEVQDFLERKGIKSLIGEPGPRCKYPGQILGCDWHSATSLEGDVDGYLYFGTGEFHSRGVALSTKKKVISINPFSEDFNVISSDLDRFMRKRAASLDSAKSSNELGILVSTKKGQQRFHLARFIRDKLEKAGYKSYIIVFDEIDPNKAVDYDFDAYVNTACPRIPFSDSEAFNVSILTPFEALVMVGEREWDSYELDEFGLSWNGFDEKEEFGNSSSEA
ncbi:MAG: diphthamide biosynthesis enzyme Dph2 [Candidatus Hadarchaeota archaeon]